MRRHSEGVPPLRLSAVGVSAALWAVSGRGGCDVARGAGLQTGFGPGFRGRYATVVGMGSRAAWARKGVGGLCEAGSYVRSVLRRRSDAHSSLRGDCRGAGSFSCIGCEGVGIDWDEYGGARLSVSLIYKYVLL